MRLLEQQIQDEVRACFKSLINQEPVADNLWLTTSKIINKVLVFMNPYIMLPKIKNLQSLLGTNPAMERESIY